MAQQKERQQGKGNGQLEVGGKGKKESSSTFLPATDAALDEQWHILFVESPKNASERDREVARQRIIDQATTLTYDWLSTFRVLTFLTSKAQTSRLVPKQLNLVTNIIGDISTFFAQQPNTTKWLVAEQSLILFGFKGYRAAVRSVNLAASQVSQAIIGNEHARLFVTSELLVDLAKEVSETSGTLLDSSYPRAEIDMQGKLFSYKTDPGKSRLIPLVEQLKMQDQPSGRTAARTRVLVELPKTSIFNQRFGLGRLRGEVTLESAFGQPTERARTLAFLAFVAAVPKGDAFYQEIINQLLIGMRDKIRLESPELVRLLVRMQEIVTEIGERLMAPALKEEIKRADVAMHQEFGGESGREFVGVGSATSDYLEPDPEFDTVFSLALDNIGSMAVLVDSMLSCALDAGDALKKLYAMPEVYPNATLQPHSVLTNLSQAVYADRFPQQRASTPQQAVRYIVSQFGDEILSGIRKRFPHNRAQIAQFERWFRLAIEDSPNGIARREQTTHHAEAADSRTFADSIFTRLGEALTKRLNSKAHEIAAISQQMLAELFEKSEKAYFGEIGTPRRVTFSEGSLPEKLGLRSVTFTLGYDGSTEFQLVSLQAGVPALFGTVKSSGGLPECVFEQAFAPESNGIAILLKQCVVAIFCDLITRERVAPAVTVGIPIRDALIGSGDQNPDQLDQEMTNASGQPAAAKKTTESRSSQQHSRPIAIPRRTVESLPSASPTGSHHHSDAMAADIEVAQRGTRQGYTPRSVEKYARFLPGAKKLDALMKKFAVMNTEQTAEEQQELVEELQQALVEVGKPSSGKLAHFVTLTPEFQKELEPIINPFNPGEVIYLKTTVDGYESPKVLQTLGGEISLQQSYEVRYRSGPKSRFLGALYAWFMQEDQAA